MTRGEERGGWVGEWRVARACFVGLYDFSLGHGNLVKDDEKSRTLVALQQSCHAPARPAHPRRPVRIRPHSVVSQPRFPTRQPPLCGVGMAATAACTRVHPGGVSWQELRRASHYFPQPAADKGKQARVEHPWLLLVAACASPPPPPHDVEDEKTCKHFFFCDRSSPAVRLPFLNLLPAMTRLNYPSSFFVAVCAL